MMIRFSPSSLRLRLMLLVSLALLPALGLILHAGLEARRGQVARAEGEALRLARNAASRQEDLIKEVRSLLFVLARLPAVRDGDGAACNVLFAELLKQYPSCANLGMADSSGNMVASVVPLARPINAADRPWFQRAVQSRGFSVGDYQIGRIIGRPALVCGYPVLSPEGRPKTVLFATLDLAWVNRLVAEARLPQGSALTVIDLNGTVLAHSLEPEAWVGRAAPEAPIVRTILARQGRGTDEVAGLDGVRRVFGYVPLRDPSRVKAAYVTVGIPPEVLFAEVDRVTARNLAVLGLVTLLALAAAWAGSNLFLLRRVKKLLGVIQRLRAGDLTARTGLQGDAGELGQMTAAFDKMAESLERHAAERRETEEALRDSEARFRTVFEFAAIGIAIDVGGRLVQTNRALQEMLGYTTDEFRAMDFTDFTHPDDVEASRRLAEGLHEGKFDNYCIEKRYCRKDGQVVWARTTVSAVRDAQGQILYVIPLIEDITERKQLEQQLFQAQKMEAIGTLAGGIAHDFNNILTGVIGFAELVLAENDLKERQRTHVARIAEQGQRAATLVAQLLAFSRQAMVERKPVSLLPLVKETVKMLGRTMPERVVLRTSLPDRIAPVSADVTQIQQVLMNLCVNASQAMPGGGELTVGLEDVTLDGAYCRRHRDARPGPHVCLWVRDTGGGMAPEVQAHIFEPFFTTKGVGEGTGLGLAMVYGIVQEHEGHVEVFSEPGKGSEFKVLLPSAERAETPGRAVPAGGFPAGGTETLLLVEDDASVLIAGQKMLERLGYTVLTAADGEEGLKVYSDHRGEIDLVLTDMGMPKMGGQELYEALRQIDAGVRVVLVSGYSVQEEVAGLRARGVKGFVQKPFDFQKLGGAVQRALNDNGDGPGLPGKDLP